MSADETISTIDKIILLWEKKIGIIYCLLAELIIFCIAARFFDSNFTLNTSYNIALPILWVITFIFWLISTHRILINKSNRLNIFVSINCDEEFEQKAKSIFEKTIKDLNRDTELQMLYSGLLPINQFSDHKEIEKWLDKQNGNHNAIIFLNIKNGKINSEEAIKLDSVSYTGYFKNNNLAIEGENLNITQDLTLRLQHKDWNYLEKNCLDDKEKLRNNLKDLILYYGGMFYLNEKQFEYSRVILKKIFNPKQLVVPAKLNPKDATKIDIEIKPNHIQAGRLNYLLSNIYLKCITDKLDSKNVKGAIVLLHEVETFPVPSEIKLRIFMNLAYMYFLDSDMEKSKHYTKLVHSINPKSFAYFINLGFYSIIENNPIALAQHYSMFDENYTIDSQPLEIIAFLNDHQHRYENSKLLFDSAAAILTKLFIDEHEGNSKLQEVIDLIPNNNQYKPLKRLCEKTHKKKFSKKVQRQRHKAKKDLKQRHSM